MRIAIDIDPGILIMVVIAIIVIFLWSMLRIAKKPTPKPEVKPCTSSETKTNSAT